MTKNTSDTIGVPVNTDYGSGTITIYYGMCGCFKYTTIQAKRGPTDIVVPSLIKPKAELSLSLLGRVPEDTEFALDRLTQLQAVFKDYVPGTTAWIERGILDYLESWTARPENAGARGDRAFLAPWMAAESAALPAGVPVRRVLLVMGDHDFVRDVVLAEPARARRYPGVQEYMSRQTEYTRFIQDNLDLDEITIIRSASDYLGGLGIYKAQHQNGKQ